MLQIIAYITALGENYKNNRHMEDWDILFGQATKSKASKELWPSLIGRVKYRISEVSKERIVIQRLNGGKDAYLSKVSVSNALNKLKKFGSLTRPELISDVVRQTSLVYLHPSVEWNPKTKRIYWSSSTQSFSEIELKVQNANDDELERIYALVLRRLNQGKFKKNMLKLYGSKCAISESTVTELLEAAHLHSYADSGDNSNSNGILLRVDLHRLFDGNLLRIEPDTLKVHVDKSLKNTEYHIFHGKKIADRINNSRLSFDSLIRKWQNQK